MAIAIPQKDKIITIISMFFPEAKIYLFGSYARGDYTGSSDLDIAIDIGKPLPLVEHSQIRTMIEALNLLQNVDVVDFRSVPEDFRENIIKDGIIWKDFLLTACCKHSYVMQ